MMHLAAFKVKRTFPGDNALNGDRGKDVLSRTDYVLSITGSDLSHESDTSIDLYLNIMIVSTLAHIYS